MGNKEEKSVTFTDIRHQDLRDYRPVPLWSWNDVLEPEELKLQIHQMQEAGFGGFFMHARAGLVTEYLSEEWMQAIETGVDTARELGMNPWIYDENGWPSGFCGMKLLEDPENLAHYLTLSEGQEIDPKAMASYICEDGVLKRVHLADTGISGSCVYNLYDNTTTSFVDVLNPAVVRKFLDSTHEQYAKRLGDKLGKVMPGFFTDEPQYYRWDTPYSPVLRTRWQEEYGEDVLEELGALLLPCVQAKPFRYRYWKMMNDLFVHAYAEQIYRWCEDHGCKLTGHTIEERILHMQMWCTAGLMPFYEYQQIPGIDWLGRDKDSPLGPRQVGSVAQQLGKKQVLSETFACAGWDATPRELRWIAELQCVDGVNLLCHHLVPYSIRGQRKRDYPAFYSAHNPWHKDLKVFNDYFTVLGYLLANSREIAPVGVIHPIRSGYLTYDRRVDGPSMEVLENRFLELITDLSRHQIGHHYLDETLLERHGRVEGTKLVLGQCCYSHIVIPEMENLASNTVQLLRKFLQNGGKVWLQGKAPQLQDGKEADLSFLSSNISFADLSCDTVKFSNPDTQLRATHRQGDLGEFVYIVNASCEESYTTQLSVRTSAIALFDIEKNSLEPIAYTAADEIVSATLTFAPMESKILVLGTKADSPAALEAGEEADVSIGPAELVGDVRNSLTLDEVQLSTDGVHFDAPVPVMALSDQLLRQGHNGKIWLQYTFHAQYLPKNLWLETEHTGYAWKINGTEVTPNCCGVLDRSFDRAQIGDLIHKGENHILLTLDYVQNPRVYQVMALPSEENESLVNCLRFDSDIEAVYLFGDFGVGSLGGTFETVEGGYRVQGPFCLTEPPRQLEGDVLTKQGLPFYAGDITFRQTVRTEQTNLLLKLEGRYATAKVVVNGKLAASLVMKNTCDLSGFLHPGENLVEVTLTAGLRNLLGPHHCKGEVDSKWQCPATFHMYGTWTDGESPLYDKAYQFCPFGAQLHFLK